MRRARPPHRAEGALKRLPALACVLALAACSGGSTTAGDDGIGAGAAPCEGSCLTTPTALSSDEVRRILAQAVQEASAQHTAATIAVVDRVGKALGVYRMDSAVSTVRLGSPAGAEGGLEGLSLVPAELSAIAKALTGAYLSSEGNAFSTRTASQILQSHFNPGEQDQPGGPLFGVQFSQLPCSDLAARFGSGTGPQRSPLGLSGDPGGLPLYKNGTPVGAVGVEVDGVYSLDERITDHDRSVDELVATAASFGFGAPRDRRADRITLDGKTLRYADVDFDNLASKPASAPAFESLAGGALVAVTGYTGTVPQILAGTAFGQPASGVAPSTDPDFAQRDAYVLVDAAQAGRYPPSAGSDGLLTTADVRSLLLSALDVAARARAQIRQPLGSSARVNISVVDSRGEIAGIASRRDAPVFGLDVSLQKARAALFASSSTAAATLQALPPAGYLQPDTAVPVQLRSVALGDYAGALRDFTGDPAMFGDGAYAFSARSIGNLARPFFPDGLSGAGAGPWSKPAGQWSPFSDGLQLDLVYNALVRHVAFVVGIAGVADVPRNCSGVQPLDAGLGVQNAATVLANGIQIFPGGMPIYRGSRLIGALGVSGDGIDQDDMVAFLGVHEAGLASSGAVGNAPGDMRSDRIEVQGTHLRYVQCPQAPFIGSSEQQACDGK